jgi:hypothetical protein
MKASTKVLMVFVAILGLPIASLSVNADQMSFGHMGWRYFGPVYKTITTQYWGQCQRTCYKESKCMSFTYGRYSKRCELRNFIPGPKARKQDNNYVSGWKIRR